MAGTQVGYDIAREIVGPAPIFVGYGVSYTDEFSKMNLHDRARKRAEAAALRLRFDVSFAVGDQEEQEAMEAEYIEGGVMEVDPDPEPEPKTEAQLLAELGY